MALKDLFTKKEKEKKPVNPTTLFGVRVLAVAYLGYSLWQIIQMYIEGGEQAPSLLLLILAIVVLGGGAVFITVATILKLKQLRDEDRARLDAEDEELARLAALEAAEETEDEAEEETEEEPVEDETEE